MEGNVGAEPESLHAPLRAGTMARRPAQGNRGNRLFPRLLWGLCQPAGSPRRAGSAQLFNSGLIFFSKSSNEVSPLIFSPLTKKVGVESTFSTSLAYFWSAAI